MREIKLNKVDEIIYEEILDNGLTVYLYKKPSFQKKFAFFQTKYGSINNSFVPLGEEEIKRFPLGIAHFLEHKLFESSDDSNVFEKLENNGSYVNAATSYDKTYYYFETVDNFKSSLEILLDFVQLPCFTDENVEKEKGIINQEIDMCDDNPERFLYQKLISNALIKSFYKYDIAGTKEEINKITKEDLYKCYNTFYNPSNMILVIGGDINIDDILNLVKENQSKKTFKTIDEIKQENVTEPDKVDIKQESYTHNVTNDKIGYCYKINLDDMNERERYKFIHYVSIYFEILFGSASGFTNYLIKNKIINSYFLYDFDMLKNKNNTMLIYFLADPINKEKLEDSLKKKLNSDNSLEDMFLLLKKNYLANFIRKFESIIGVVNLIRSSYANYGQVFNDYYDMLENLNYKDFEKCFKAINYDNYVEVLLKPKTGVK